MKKEKKKKKQLNNSLYILDVLLVSGHLCHELSSSTSPGACLLPAVETPQMQLKVRMLLQVCFITNVGPDLFTYKAVLKAPSGLWNRSKSIQVCFLSSLLGEKKSKFVVTVGLVPSIWVDRAYQSERSPVLVAMPTTFG